MGGTMIRISTCFGALISLLVLIGCASSDDAWFQEQQKRYDLITNIRVDRLTPGMSVDQAKRAMPENVTQRELSVAIQGVTVGYRLVAYQGHTLAEPNASYVTLLFQDERYVRYIPEAAEIIALSIAEDLISHLHGSGAITLSAAEDLRARARLGASGKKIDQIDEELLLYQAWQAKRVDQGEISIEEYRYLTLMKGNELARIRAAADSQAQLSLVQHRDLELRRKQLLAQQEATDIQRRALMSQTILNGMRSAYQPPQVYQPPQTLTCESSALGYTVTTRCR